MEQILLPSRLGWITIPTGHILRLEGDGNYTVFILIDGQRLVYSKTISFFESQLPFPFVRVHKSTIVNLGYLSQGKQNKKKELLMTDGYRVAISRRRRSDVKSWLSQYRDLSHHSI